MLCKYLWRELSVFIYNQFDRLLGCNDDCRCLTDANSKEWAWYQFGAIVSFGLGIVNFYNFELNSGNVENKFCAFFTFCRCNWIFHLSDACKSIGRFFLPVEKRDQLMRTYWKMWIHYKWENAFYQRTNVTDDRLKHIICINNTSMKAFATHTKKYK